MVQGPPSPALFFACRHPIWSKGTSVYMQTKAGNLEPAHLMQRFARRPGRAAPLALPRGRGPAGSDPAVGVSVLRCRSAPCPVDLMTTPWPHTRKSGSGALQLCSSFSNCLGYLSSFAFSNSFRSSLLTTKRTALGS